MDNQDLDHPRSNNHKLHRGLRVALLIVASFLSFLALILPLALRQDSLPLQSGDVATSDVISPRTVSYESKYLTEKAKEDAANAIAPVYLAADPSINRAQLEKLNRALDFITSVRNDPYSDESEKIGDLENLCFPDGCRTCRKDTDNSGGSLAGYKG